LRPLPIEEVDEAGEFEDLEPYWLVPGTMPEPYWDFNMGQEFNYNKMC